MIEPVKKEIEGGDDQPPSHETRRKHITIEGLEFMEEEFGLPIDTQMIGNELADHYNLWAFISRLSGSQEPVEIPRTLDVICVYRDPFARISPEQDPRLTPNYTAIEVWTIAEMIKLVDKHLPLFITPGNVMETNQAIISAMSIKWQLENNHLWNKDQPGNSQQRYNEALLRFVEEYFGIELTEEDKTEAEIYHYETTYSRAIEDIVRSVPKVRSALLHRSIAQTIDSTYRARIGRILKIASIMRPATRNNDLLVEAFPMWGFAAVAGQPFFGQMIVGTIGGTLVEQLLALRRAYLSRRIRDNVVIYDEDDS